MMEPNSGGGMEFMFMLFLFAGFYFYFAYCMVRMAQKLNHDDIAWWGWVPILNTFLLIKMAGKPGWWFVLLLVPIVNIFCFFKLWMDVSKSLGQGALWGFLAMIPVIQLAALGVMAFGSGSQPNRYAAGSAPASSAPTRERVM